MKIFLASTSPRRHGLMDVIGYDFEIISPDIDETEEKGESPAKMVERFACEKAIAAFEKIKDYPSEALLITADTTVVSPDRKKILNKPKNVDEAKTMLRAIAGKTHTVLTGYVICSFKAGKIKKWHSRIVKTSVTMRSLNSREIADYVKTGEPMDKAGSYAAQGIGMCLIEAIKGSYSNVVGLPMAELVLDLEKKFGVKPKWKS